MKSIIALFLVSACSTSELVPTIESFEEVTSIEPKPAEFSDVEVDKASCRLMARQITECSNSFRLEQCVPEMKRQYADCMLIHGYSLK